MRRSDWPDWLDDAPSGFDDPVLVEAGRGLAIFKAGRKDMGTVRLLVFAPRVSVRLRELSENLRAQPIAMENLISLHLLRWEGPKLVVATDWVQGKRISELDSPMPAALALETSLALAEMLAHAEQLGVSESAWQPGFLSPETVWILDDGRVAVETPSVAAALELARGRRGLAAMRSMAPEQVLGGQVDMRTDVFRSAALFYHLLTGNHPFEADTPSAFVAKLKAGPANPPSCLAPWLTGAVDRVVTQGLAFEPAARPTPAEWLQALTGLRSEIGDTSQDVPILPPPEAVHERPTEIVDVQDAVPREAMAEQPTVILDDSEGSESPDVSKRPRRTIPMEAAPDVTSEQTRTRMTPLPQTSRKALDWLSWVLGIWLCLALVAAIWGGVLSSDRKKSTVGTVSGRMLETQKGRPILLIDPQSLHGASVCTKSPGGPCVPPLFVAKFSGGHELVGFRLRSVESHNLHLCPSDKGKCFRIRVQPKP